MQELESCKKILIEINQTCNLNCTYCFYRDYGRVTNSLNLNDIDNLILTCPNADEFYLTGGECFTSPNIDTIIEKLSSKGKVIIFTNGTMLSNYDDKRLYMVAKNTNRFIISFDSFDFKNYACREKLDITINVIKKLLAVSSEIVEVKVCITNYNYEHIDEIFEELIKLGVKYLSVNFVFDIENSNLAHEVKNLKKLKSIFEKIYKYKEYFNMKYIKVLYDLYIANEINEDFPCLADESYYYLDCNGDYLICPGNCKKLGKRGNWKGCYSKECANEWEIMYMR